ncbi:MAG: hypothetical protein LV481_00115 [Methylacidiphilales bacterium]|nr:hypothetical protein [Candidatus Methylacidiphilales bacterium]
MSKLSDSVRKFINIAGLTAKIRSLEAELVLLKELQRTLGVKTRGRKAGKVAVKAKSKRSPRGKVKKAVLAYLQKNGNGKAIEIAKLSGLKVTSVHQTLFGLKKAGHVRQNKKRGSPFVLVKK